MRANGNHLRLHPILRQRGVGAIDEHDGSSCTQNSGGTKRHRGVLALRSAVNPGALRPVERHFFAIHGEKVLPEELAQMLEPVAKAADNREVSSHSVLRLGNVDDIQHDDQGDEAAHCE